MNKNYDEFSIWRNTNVIISTVVTSFWTALQTFKSRHTNKFPTQNSVYRQFLPDFVIIIIKNAEIDRKLHIFISFSLCVSTFSIPIQIPPLTCFPQPKNTLRYKPLASFAASARNTYTKNANKPIICFRYLYDNSRIRSNIFAIASLFCLPPLVFYRRPLISLPKITVARRVVFTKYRKTPKKTPENSTLEIRYLQDTNSNDY